MVQVMCAQPLDIFRFLKVKGAQLDADDQHLGVRGRADDMALTPPGVDFELVRRCNLNHSKVSYPAKESYLGKI